MADAGGEQDPKLVADSVAGAAAAAPAGGGGGGDAAASGAGAGDAAAASAAAPDAAAAAPAAAAPAFKQRKNRGNIRKRGGGGGDEAAGGAGGDDDDDETAVVRKAKQAKGEPLAFTTKKDSKDAVVVTYASDRALPVAGDGGATRILETETEFDRDARARREKVLARAAAAAAAAGGSDGAAAAAAAAGGGDGTYQGMTGYTDYKAAFRRDKTVGSEKGSGAHGPLRASAFVRVSARFDYQPDVCKDYKETGFCSYGDACKFMHDRGDYKSGWELDREWEEEQKRRQEALQKGWGADGDEDEAEGGDDDEDDGLPFACYICRKPWAECGSEPVVTKCRHYFCESCALK